MPGSDIIHIKVEPKTTEQMAVVVRPSAEAMTAAVGDWLEAHPEATTTVQDGSVTAIKLRQGDTGVVNVLSLGVKNDGSADCAAILNAYSGTLPLFFPTGHYRFDSTFYPKVSIIGTAYSRVENPDFSAATVFLQGGTNYDMVRYECPTRAVGKNVLIRDICIQLSLSNTSDVSGLYIGLNGYANHFTLNHVSVLRLLYGYGIQIVNPAPNPFSSRCVYMSNIFVRGNSSSAHNFGIFTGANLCDGMLDTVEVMGCRRGIALTYGVWNLANVHIWCGIFRAGDDTQILKQNIGLALNDRCRVSCSNLYIDTCYMAVGFIGHNSTLSVSNLTYWDDGALTDVLTTIDAWGGLIYSENPDNSVSISNAIIKIPARHDYLTSANIMDAEISGNIRIYHSSEHPRYRGRSFRNVLPAGEHIVYTHMPTDSTVYVPIAVLAYYGLDSAVTNKIHLRISQSTGTVDDFDAYISGGTTPTFSVGDVTRSGTATSSYRLLYEVLGEFLVIYEPLHVVSSGRTHYIDVKVTDSALRCSMLNPVTQLFETREKNFFDEHTKTTADSLTAMVYV